MIQFGIWVAAVLLGLTIMVAVPAVLALLFGRIIEGRDRQVPIDTDLHPNELCQ